MKTVNVKVEIFNPNKTTNRILDSDVGLFVASTWARYFAKYVPMQTGMLRDNIDVGTPWKVTYNSPYAHYIWEGIKYVEPISGKSGFHNTDYSLRWTTPGTIKVPTEQQLNYNKEQNPLATSHWEVPAYQAFGNIVADMISEYIRRKK